MAALGGIFVGLIAPYLFRGYFELQIGLGLCAILAATLFATDLKPPLLAVRRRRWRLRWRHF